MEPEPEYVEDMEEIRHVLASMDPAQTSLITLLQAVQARFGYLPRDAMVEVARLKGISPATVFGVASFYNQFRMVPPGKYPIRVCMGTACHIKGGKAILRVWEAKLGIREGQVTDDRFFSLDRAACVGCCAMAPVALVGEEVHGHMIPTTVDGILLAVQRAGKQEEEKADLGEEAGSGNPGGLGGGTGDR